ncbi:lysozyme, partial [Acinetobacter baumannii]
MSSMVSTLASVQMAQIAQTYSWLRAMSGGKLTQEQVTAGDEIIEKAGLETFAKLIGYKLESGVTGQWD